MTSFSFCFICISHHKISPPDYALLRISVHLARSMAVVILTDKIESRLFPLIYINFSHPSEVLFSINNLKIQSCLNPIDFTNDNLRATNNKTPLQNNWQMIFFLFWHNLEIWDLNLLKPSLDCKPLEIFGETATSLEAKRRKCYPAQSFPHMQSYYLCFVAKV